MTTTGDRTSMPGCDSFKDRLLALLAGRRVGLTADFDGLRDSGQGVIPAGCRTALRALAVHPHFAVIAVISANSAHDALAWVGIPDLIYVGDCGLETLNPDAAESEIAKAARPYRPLIASVLDTTRYALYQQHHREEDAAWLDSLIFENKGASGVIHDRACPDPAYARAIILAEVEPLARAAGLRLYEEPQGVTLRPPAEINKGTALITLAQTYHLDGLIHLSTDASEQYGFRALRELERDSRAAFNAVLHPPGGFQGMAVRIRSADIPHDPTGAADFDLEGIIEVEHFLHWLRTAVPIDQTL